MSRCLGATSTSRFSLAFGTLSPRRLAAGFDHHEPKKDYTPPPPRTVLAQRRHRERDQGRRLPARYADELLNNELVKRLEVDLQIGLGGTKKTRKNGRAPASVASILRALKAALNFAHEMKWVDEPCNFKIEQKHRTTSRGRPLKDDEVELMIEAVKEFCPHDVDGWTFLIRGILATGLRLEEMHCMTWDELGTIRPLRSKAGHVVLDIPPDMQKNGEEDIIATMPEFSALLDSVPNEQRTGYIFSPKPRRTMKGRLSVHQMGRIVCDIGKASGVVVNKTGKRASAHDLRRTFAMRLIRRGVNLVDVQSVMRHADFTTTRAFYLQAEAEEVAERLAEKMGPAKKYLGTPADEEQKKDSHQIDVSP